MGAKASCHAIGGWLDHILATMLCQAVADKADVRRAPPGGQFAEDIDHQGPGRRIARPAASGLVIEPAAALKSHAIALQIAANFVEPPGVPRNDDQLELRKLRGERREHADHDLVFAPPRAAGQEHDILRTDAGQPGQPHARQILPIELGVVELHRAADAQAGLFHTASCQKAGVLFGLGQHQVVALHHLPHRPRRQMPAMFAAEDTGVNQRQRNAASFGGCDQARMLGPLDDHHGTGANAIQYVRDRAGQVERTKQNLMPRQSVLRQGKARRSGRRHDNVPAGMSLFKVRH
jgi:hypothetical protein